MKNFLKITILTLLLFDFSISSGYAASYSVGYDFGPSIFEPHPFLSQNKIINKVQDQGKMQLEKGESNRLVRLKNKPSSTIKNPKNSPVINDTKTKNTGINNRSSVPFWDRPSWLSEIKVGILKHSAPISTSTPKEKGIDANVEVLFVSPQFFDYILAPRPHVGVSFNGSSKDTDQIYSGLTWSWKPFRHLFVDASFGFAIHNGVRGTSSNDPLEGRVREFGCDWLFRESLELGIPFFKTQRISVMWDHVSHGGICASENEGMDNLGLRYGYQF